MANKSTWDYSVVNILVNLLSDGEATWNIVTPSRDRAVHLVTRKVRQWKISTPLNAVYQYVELCLCKIKCICGNPQEFKQ